MTTGSTDPVDAPAAGGDGPFARCSFCGLPNTQVARLIAGPGVYVCDRCVGACVAILEQAGDDGPAPPPRLPEWGAMSDEEMLGHIPRIAATGRQVEASLHAWVAELRSRGVTWARLGDALGMTRQSAWERFSAEP